MRIATISGRIAVFGLALWWPLAACGAAPHATRPGMLSACGIRPALQSDQEASRAQASRGEEFHRQGNYASAWEWYTRAALAGDADAQYGLGLLLEHGRGAPQDLAAAAQCYERAANQGHASAQTNLAVLLANGDGVPRDLARAVELYTKAADQGVAVAKSNLAMLLEEGDGVQRDLTRADTLYREAGALGDQAGREWATHLAIGRANGMSIEAVWLWRWAKDGDAESQYRLSGKFARGDGVRRDEAMAREWLTAAAEGGYPEAQNDIGLLYLNGWLGMPRDYAHARSSFEAAADQGHAMAHFNLGVIHLKGLGVDKSTTTALEHLEASASAGLAQAYVVLGSIYSMGELLPKDDCKARGMFEVAARQEEPEGLFRLGQLYQFERCVELSGAAANHRAVELFRSAVAGGHADAEKALEVTVGLYPSEADPMSERTMPGLSVQLPTSWRQTNVQPGDISPGTTATLREEHASKLASVLVTRVAAPGRRPDTFTKMSREDLASMSMKLCDPLVAAGRWSTRGLTCTHETYNNQVVILLTPTEQPTHGPAAINFHAHISATDAFYSIHLHAPAAARKEYERLFARILQSTHIAP